MSKLPQDLYDLVFEEGCMYHKDAGQCPVFPSSQYYRVHGDLWCQAGLTEFLEDDVVRVRAVRV